MLLVYLTFQVTRCDKVAGMSCFLLEGQTDTINAASFCEALQVQPTLNQQKLTAMRLHSRQ